MWRIRLLILFPFILMARVQVINSDCSGLTFRYEPGQFFWTKDDRGRVVVRFEDTDSRRAGFGEYDLPSEEVRIGIPQEGGVRVRFKTEIGGVLEGEEPAVVPFVPFEEDGAAEMILESNKAAVIPAAPVMEADTGILRSIRFITLRLSPVQYQPALRKLTWFKEIEVTVEFERRAAVNSVPDPLDGLIGEMLLNGAVAKDWKVNPLISGDNPYRRSPVWLKITIDSTGIYRITGQELAQVGVPVGGLDPKDIALWTAGEYEPNKKYPDSLRPVGVFITGDEDGRFDIEDTIIFYGLAVNRWVNRCSVYVKNLFTRENVYWLTWSGAPGIRVRGGFGPDTTGTPILRSGDDVLHQEVDAECPARGGLLWVWRTLSKSAEAERAIFSCVLDLSYPMQVRRIAGRLFSVSPNNNMVVRLNRQEVSGFSFGVNNYPTQYDFRIDTLLPVSFQNNRLELELTGTGEKKVYIDYLEVDYRRRLSLAFGQLHFLVDTVGVFRFVVQDVPDEPVVMDVSNPYQPRVSLGFEVLEDSIRFCYRLGGKTEFAIASRRQLMRPRRMELKSPGRLWNETERVDYWIITPAEWLGVAQELARFRNNRVQGIAGARAVAVTLEEVYDNFSFGLAEPGGVKRFLQRKRPAYVLLVGDATYDYRNNLNRTKTPGVPAYEAGFGLIPDASDRSALALDVWYADLEGEGASPDLILGRLPVRSGEEFRVFLDKLVAYETGAVDYWVRRYLLLADDEYQSYPSRPDELRFRHIEQCEGMALLAGSWLDAVKVYLTDFPFLGAKSKPQANAELMRQLNMGALLWVFFGHGSAYALTHEEVFTVARLADLKNGNRVPFCFFGSCSVGRFDDTRFECIAEELVRMTGGAVGTVAASTATPSGSNLVFARNLLSPLFSPPESTRTIGYGFLKAWPTDRSYHLFGDPATVLRLPVISAQMPLLVPDTLRPGVFFRARAIVESQRGEAIWRFCGPTRLRQYDSPLGITIGYFREGMELARGSFAVRDGRFYCEGFFPLGVPLDTVFVGNGFYAPVPNSCRLTAMVVGDTVDWTVLSGRLPFDTIPVVVEDRTGPQIRFFFAGRPLADSAVVPEKMEVEVVLSDPAGIFIAPVAGKRVSCWLNDRNGEFDVTDHLVFDDSSFSCARLRLPLVLGGPIDSLFLAASDNFLNRTVAKIFLRARLSGVLRVDSVFVYPNPVKDRAFFSFVLSQPATVRVRIYSLAGKLLRDLGEFTGGFGYNQIFWDGRDSDGVPLPNGVYLFVVRAQGYSAGSAQRVIVRDKFLIGR